MKALKAQLAEEKHAAFQAGAAAHAKKVLANFKDYEFVSPTSRLFFSLLLSDTLLQFTGDSDPEQIGMVVLLNYRVRTNQAAPVPG